LLESTARAHVHRVSDSLPIELWFDFASTYSYPAAVRLEALARDASVRVEYKPFLLGPLFQRQGWNDSPFNLYPVKGRYMWRDMDRVCADLGIPFRRPSVFPRNSVLAARIAIVGVDQGWIAPYVRAVFRAAFAEDRDIARAEELEAILDALGHDGRAIRELAESPGWKPRLRAQTALAEARGIFGAPSFVVGEELFWGNDRLERAIAWARAARSG
jgi:2-hydroxychromene-2-carboxylate isomerase